MFAGDTGRRLIPDDIADEVRHVDIVDRSPHAAVLYGVHLDGDNRPDFIREGMNGIHDRKIAEARLNLAEAGNDGGPILAACNSFVLLPLVAGNSNRSSVLRWRDRLDCFRDAHVRNPKWTSRKHPRAIVPPGGL